MSKYLIYHSYDNLSLLDSAIALLDELGISFVQSSNFYYYGGYYGKIINEDKFFLANAISIAKASSQNADLLVLEEDAFYNLTLAKKQIDENLLLFSTIENALSKYNLKYNSNTKVVFINDLLMQNLDSIKAKTKLLFSDFSASIFHSSRNVMDIATTELFALLDLKILYDTRNAYFQYELFNPSLAYKYSAKGLEEAFDLGSDFVISNSMGVFNIFDKRRNNISKIANRDFLNLPVLFLPQVLLLSFGIKDDTKLGFRYHKVPVEFI